MEKHLDSEMRELLKEKIYLLLEKVGMKIENEEIVSTLLKKGATQSPRGRVKFGKEMLDEVIFTQKKRQQEERQNLMKKNSVRQKPNSEFKMNVFGHGPTRFYDYESKKILPIDTKIFIEMMKFAQSISEINSINIWPRQDVPPKIEAIDSLILGLKYTNKIHAAEAMYSQQIKYLIEISEVMDGKISLGGSQCITSPLILGKRSADEMLERAKIGLRYYVASMITIGISTPLTLADAVFIAAAEILGGWVVAYNLNPEVELIGRIISSVVNMKNGEVNFSGPETTLVDLGVKELFDTCFGGHLRAGMFYGCYARTPGLGAVYENFYGSYRFAKLTGNSDIPYLGEGTLNNDGIGSPTQAILDMEIRKSQFYLKNEITISKKILPFEEICEIIGEGKDFFSIDHTLRHFRDLWSSRIFLTEADAEKDILDKCDKIWRENIKNYQPPELSEKKSKALENILEKAKKELLKT